MGVFDFKTVAGQIVIKDDLSKNVQRLVVSNTMEEECVEYAQYLIGLGFDKVVEKSIPTDSENSYKRNLYYAFKGKDKNVHVFYDCSLHTISIVSVEKEDLQEAESFINSDVVLTQHAIRMGMCYTIKLGDGQFIIVDGGISDQKDIDDLYRFMCGNSDEKVKVALWIFTHPHVDHIGLAKDFIKKYKDKVDVKAFGYNFPDCDRITVAMESTENMAKDIVEFSNVINCAYPNAKTYLLHTGQRLYFTGVEIEILYTPENEHRKDFSNFNEFSIAFRVNTKNGKSVMFLGDLMHLGCRNLFHTYGDYLKSDILQVAHHGLIGGDKDLYKKIDPEICLWSTPEERFNGNFKEKFHWCLGEGGCDYNAFLRDNSIRERTHYHGGKTVSIILSEV